MMDFPISVKGRLEAPLISARGGQPNGLTGLYADTGGSTQLLSLLCDIRRLQDGRPAVDLRFHEPAELRWRALALGRDRSAELGELRRHAGIIQGFVERGRQLVDDCVRRALGRENPCPDAHLIIEPVLLRSWHAGQPRYA